MKKKIKVKVKVKKDCFNCGHLVRFYNLTSGECFYVCALELLHGIEAKSLVYDFKLTDHYFYCGGSKWIEVN